jgi:hypothetical protein
MKDIYRISTAGALSLASSLFFISPAYAYLDQPDGGSAYRLGCAILWAGGSLGACRELPSHPCRPSNPERPEACDYPDPGDRPREVPSE